MINRNTELKDMLISPINHEQMEVVCSKQYYKLKYDNDNIKEICYIEGDKRLSLGQISTLYIEDVQYTFEISNIDIKYEDLDNWTLIVSGNKKNVSYLFLLPLCDIINEIPALPIDNVFIDKKYNRTLYIQVSKHILKNESKDLLEYVKEDDKFIYIKETIRMKYLNDIKLIREGKYSRISNETKEKIYKYHICILMDRNQSSIYDILEKTEKRRIEIYDKYGVMPKEEDELYSKITEKEYYEI